MAEYGQHSKSELITCHVNIQLVMNKVIKYHDCRILGGFRNEEGQDLLYKMGRSRVEFPNSKHNTVIDGVPCSSAVDAVPWPLKDWNDYPRFVYFAGIVLGIAFDQGISLRWGGDWNMDHNLKNQHFFDLCHFELKEV